MSAAWAAKTRDSSQHRYQLSSLILQMLKHIKNKSISKIKGKATSRVVLLLVQILSLTAMTVHLV